MAAPPVRFRTDCDFLIKLLLVGDPDVGKSSMLLRFEDSSYTTTCYDLKIRNIELDGKRIKLEVWDTAGNERFRTIARAYYKGAMGILLVYDVTDESSFSNIKNWKRLVDQYISNGIKLVLVGNKADIGDSKRAVPTSKGKALADEFGIEFFETESFKGTNSIPDVEQVFFSIARDITRKLIHSKLRKKLKTIKTNEAGKSKGYAKKTRPQWLLRFFRNWVVSKKNCK